MKTEDTGALWAGEFGSDYIKRNSNLPDRSNFWNKMAYRFKPSSVLEVGCNIGHNLRYLKAALPKAELFGCDVNEEALAILRAQLPGISTDIADVRDLPYEDKSFDMVVCVGVLIHVTNSADLERAVSELFRVSSNKVLVAEYWAYDWTLIPYHGYDNALRKGPFDRILNKYGKIRDAGPLWGADGFDRVHYWVYSV